MLIAAKSVWLHAEMNYDGLVAIDGACDEFKTGVNERNMKKSKMIIPPEGLPDDWGKVGGKDLPDTVLARENRRLRQQVETLRTALKNLVDETDAVMTPIREGLEITIEKVH